MPDSKRDGESQYKAIHSASASLQHRDVRHEALCDGARLLKRPLGAWRSGTGHSRPQERVRARGAQQQHRSSTLLLPSSPLLRCQACLRRFRGTLKLAMLLLSKM